LPSLGIRHPLTFHILISTWNWTRTCYLHSTTFINVNLISLALIMDLSRGIKILVWK
jgi:hypothetical protein